MRLPIEKLPLDKVVSTIAGLGVPGLVLLIAISVTGLAGGAAISASLASLGPGGMLGGIATLGAIALISKGLSEYGFDAIFSSVVKELYKRGESKESLIEKVNGYPVSASLKRKLKEELEKLNN